MSNYLLDHALNNVWCSPRQDNQIVISGPRICKDIGALNYISVYDRIINLPTKGERYYAYAIGQIAPKTLGLFSTQLDLYTDTWTSLANSINVNKMWIDLCMENGISLPKFSSYYMFTKEHGLIIATKLYPNIAINDRVFLRVYTNAYFQSVASDELTDDVYCYGTKILNTNEILSLETRINNYKSREGSLFYYCNGYAVGKLDLISLNIGDVVEFVFDSSIKQIAEFKFDELKEFTSTLDSINKYLLHRTDDDVETIDYFDDLELFVVRDDAKFVFKGLYYLRTWYDSLRSVTHRDYSVPIAYLNPLRIKVSEAMSDISQLDPSDKILLYVRKSGLDRKLTFENQRLKDLYKLSDDKIMQAMIGANSLVPEWTAASLENSVYAKMLGAEYVDFTQPNLKELYGYNAASVYLGYTPSVTKLKSGRQSADLPYMLTKNSTVYEYDENGYLLGYYYHTYGSDYEARNSNTRLIEAISGLGSDTPKVLFGTTVIDLPELNAYRVYMCYKDADGIPNNKWKDITGTNLYHVTNNKLVWNNLEEDQFLMVRTDETFLTYTLNVTPVDGVVFFTLAEYEDRGDGLKLNALPVPLGDLDIWVNKKALIKDLGYYVDFPKVYIVDKDCLNQPANSTQEITVRFTGLSDKDFNLDKVEDYGFIEHGFLSNNNRYDIRDDKVMRIVVDGKTMHRSSLLFSEEHDGISVSNTLNGRPYQVKDIVVPTTSVLGGSTYEYKAASEVIDKRIADYMTIKLPQPIRNASSAVMRRYEVYSPFLCKIIFDIINKHFDNSELVKPWNTNKLLELCKPYEYLLELKAPASVDQRYILITPHSSNVYLELNINQYKFLQAVVKVYFDNKVDLTSSIRISTIGDV